MITEQNKKNNENEEIIKNEHKSKLQTRKKTKSPYIKESKKQKIWIFLH